MDGTGTPAVEHRAMRADARRNYGRLLAAADAAFTEHGAEASLEDIARRAGVGIGTLYRHFPTRMALLEAVYLDRVRVLGARADELRRTRSAGDALDGWLRALAAHNITYRGLKGLLLTAMRDEGSPLSSCRGLLTSAATDLLGRAQEAGVVRSDVEPPELLKLVHAVVVASEYAPDHAAQVDRLLTVMLDGLRHSEPAGR
jgi:AcrR family transcriptional regulator